MELHFEGSSLDLVYSPSATGVQATIVHESNIAFKVLDNFCVYDKAKFTLGPTAYSDEKKQFQTTEIHYGGKKIHTYTSFDPKANPEVAPNHPKISIDYEKEIWKTEYSFEGEDWSEKYTLASLWYNKPSDF